MSENRGRHYTKWIGNGQKPTCSPDPDYPNGRSMDLTNDATPNCTVTLPHYPSDGRGVWVIGCFGCKLRIAITSAGRPDDPRTVKMACLSEAAHRSR